LGGPRRSLGSGEVLEGVQTGQHRAEGERRRDGDQADPAQARERP